MKKLKKYLYPVAFSAGFVVTYILLVAITNTISEVRGDTGYGGLVFGLSFLVGWIGIFLPFYCVRYSKMIVDERFRFLFAVYNGFVVATIHVFPFNLMGEEQITIAFFVWVALWSVVPFCFRLYGCKYCDRKAAMKHGEGSGGMKKHKCPCCGHFTLDTKGEYDICPVCFWEDDPSQCDDETRLGANKVNLINARRNYKAFGACEAAMLPHVRKPTVEEGAESDTRT